MQCAVHLVTKYRYVIVVIKNEKPKIAKRDLQCKKKTEKSKCVIKLCFFIVSKVYVRTADVHARAKTPLGSGAIDKSDAMNHIRANLRIFDGRRVLNRNISIQRNPLRAEAIHFFFFFFSVSTIIHHQCVIRRFPSGTRPQSCHRSGI